MICTEEVIVLVPTSSHKDKPEGKDSRKRKYVKVPRSSYSSFFYF